MPLPQHLNGKLRNNRSFFVTKMILKNYSWVNLQSPPSFSLQERHNTDAEIKLFCKFSNHFIKFSGIWLDGPGFLPFLFFDSQIFKIVLYHQVSVLLHNSSSLLGGVRSWESYSPSLLLSINVDEQQVHNLSETQFLRK